MPLKRWQSHKCCKFVGAKYSILNGDAVGTKPKCRSLVGLMFFHPTLGRCWAALIFFPRAVICLDVSAQAQFFSALGYFYSWLFRCDISVLIRMLGDISEFPKVSHSSHRRKKKEGTLFWACHLLILLSFSISHALRWCFVPKERSLGSGMDVVKPPVLKLGRGQRGSRKTLWWLRDAKW